MKKVIIIGASGNIGRRVILIDIKKKPLLQEWLHRKIQPKRLCARDEIRISLGTGTAFLSIEYYLVTILIYF